MSPFSYSSSGFLPQEVLPALSPDSEQSDPLLIVDSVQFLDESGIYYNTIDFDYFNMLIDPLMPPPFLSGSAPNNFDTIHQEPAANEDGESFHDQLQSAEEVNENPLSRVGESESYCDTESSEEVKQETFESLVNVADEKFDAQDVEDSTEVVDLVVASGSEVPAEMHMCKDCQKSFRRIYDLHRHYRIHSGDMPYKCLPCNTRFRRTDARQRHWNSKPECFKQHEELTKDTDEGKRRLLRQKKANIVKETA